MRVFTYKYKTHETFKMYNTLQFFHHQERMLKSLNSASSFSMENLLAKMQPNGKISPENLVININGNNLDDNGRTSEENLRLMQDNSKSSMSPCDVNRVESENDRLSPLDKTETYINFNNCLKTRICSHCGRLDCNFLQCKMHSDTIIKDNKPVLKFSVSAILGNEEPDRNTRSGKNLLTIQENLK